jgi:chromosome segregation ATPase
MRGEKAAAERRALRAETDAGKERSSAAAAAATHAQQTEAWGEERERLVATIDSLSATLGATQAELGTCRHNLKVLDSQLPDLAARLERGAGALVRVEGQLALTQKRGGELERLLVAKGEEAEVLRNAAVLAEGRQRALLTTLRATEKELADANSRATALASAEREQEKSMAGLLSETESLGQTAAAAAAEIATLKDELSRRPPIDVIKELDVENLLQRNMQAAAAMHSLLAWQNQHAANPVGATLRSTAAPPPQPPSKF